MSASGRKLATVNNISYPQQCKKKHCTDIALLIKAPWLMPRFDGPSTWPIGDHQSSGCSSFWRFFRRSSNSRSLITCTSMIRSGLS